ncbi:MAG: hypothetical protein HQM12_01480 [SAR324 cluster bacterium]|nr:hypothetical protein [SAR324 cluster bacterium]
MKRCIFSLLVWMMAFTSLAQAESWIQEAYYRSYSYEKIQDYDNALKTLMPVYQKYPEGYNVNLRFGWIYYLKGAYANALEHYQKSITAAPYSVTAKLGHTLPLMAQQKWEQVTQELYEVINTDYYNYYGNLRLSYGLRMQKKFDLAEKVIYKMLLIYPTDISLLTELLLIRITNGQQSEAEKIATDLLILDPENIIAKGFFQSNPN